MYHIVSPNTVYDIVNEEKIEISLNQEKKNIDVAQFLDDVSVWMDKNRETVAEKYLPFCVLSVGVVPVNVSAFMYGMFVGKAMAKHNLSIKNISIHADKNAVMDEIEKNMDYYNGLLGDNIKDNFKENKDDRGKQK